MRRLLVSLALPLAAALALTGCDLHLGPYAAVVDGTTISQGQLNDSLASAAASPGYLCSVTSGYQVPISTKGAGTNTYDVTFVDFILRTLVRSKLASDEARRQHVTATSFVTPIAQGQLSSSLGSSVQGCNGNGPAILATLAPAYRDALLSFYEDLDVLGASKMGITLTNAGLTSYAESHPEDSEVVCLNYFEASSAAAAQKAEAAIKKGTPFTTEVPKVTIATSTTVPCTPLGQFPAVISAALGPLPIGGVTAPVVYQGNIYVFQVSSRQVATPTQFVQVLLSNIENGFSALIAHIDASGTVQIDPAYGTWSQVSSSSGPITPPAVPPTQFVPAPSAVVGTPIVNPTATTTPSGTTPPTSTTQPAGGG